MGKLIEPVIQRWVTQPLGKLLQRNAQQLERVVEAASPGAGAELSCRASSREGGECVSVAGELGSATELSLVRPNEPVFFFAKSYEPWACELVMADLDHIFSSFRSLRSACGPRSATTTLHQC